MTTATVSLEKTPDTRKGKDLIDRDSPKLYKEKEITEIVGGLKMKYIFSALFVFHVSDKSDNFNVT